jgi:hypothetical protein
MVHGDERLEGAGQQVAAIQFDADKTEKKEQHQGDGDFPVHFFMFPAVMQGIEDVCYSFVEKIHHFRGVKKFQGTQQTLLPACTIKGSSWQISGQKLSVKRMGGE